MKLLMRDSLNFEAGRAEGEKQGIIKANLATAKRMLSLGFKISEIMETTQLSLNDLNSLLQQA
ncbi:MAG: hypothetical protein IJ576_10675 [Synergistaceae bacterium]|nr:hypothetical protein [Synergistaceae bacterium]